tara:strand:- start:19947 stop:21062 length:1116 start_codon:yes stop_codon:yes gene_type:complete
MKRKGKLLLALGLMVLMGAGVAGGAWLRYGEAIGVLKALLNGSTGALLTDVSRADVQIRGAETHADYYVYEGLDAARAVLVFVPGLTPAGRDDTRVTAVAGVLARARFRVVVPQLPGASTFRTDEADNAVLELVLTDVSDDGGLPLVVVAISYGQGPALIALSDPELAEALDTYVGLGGYYDALSVVRFTTTGAVGRETAQEILEPDPRARWILLMANAALVSSPLDRATLTTLASQGLYDGPPDVMAIATVMAGLQPDAHALLTFIANTDPARVEDLLANLDPVLRDGVLAVSPSLHDLSPLEGKLLLIHGDADPIVPIDESRRLADAVEGTRLIVVPGFSHIDSEATGIMGQIAMIRAVTALLDTRALP